jgi:hypothetical protein
MATRWNPKHIELLNIVRHEVDRWRILLTGYNFVFDGTYVFI